MIRLTKKRHALITGATGGIGSSYAMQLASMGFDLILTSRKKFELDFLKTNLSKKFGVNVKILVADLSKEADVKKLITLAKKVDNLAILINNAGFGIGEFFEEMDEKYIFDMLAVHNHATVMLTKELLPQLLTQNKSYIINVSSIAGFFPFKKSSLYSATKAFLISFSESLHLELKKKGVKVQALCPGFTKTRFFDTVKQNDFNVPITSLSRTASKKDKDKLFKRNGLWMSPERVVRKSLYDLKNKKNKVICIPGFHNRVMRRFASLLPKRLYYMFMS